VKETAAERKARGAVYTPPEITRFLSSWAVRARTDRVLEPSAGDGNFLGAAEARLRELGGRRTRKRLIAVERDPGEAAKCRALVPWAEVRAASFFDLTRADLGSVDAVIGNPPYIRYHGWKGEDRKASVARAAEQGVRLTNLSSSWASFVVHSASFLRKGGRLALVLPAELLTTDYAEPVRAFLSGRFPSVVVIAFDRLVFDDALVDAVLLLASSDDEAGLRIVRARDLAALAQVDLGPAATAATRPVRRRWSASLDIEAEVAYAELVESGSAVRLGEIASCDIGVVTGNNGFFILSEADAERLGLPREVLTPIVCRPADVRGLTVLPSETSLLLDLRGKPWPTDAALVAYLHSGEQSGVSDGYKTSNRKPWFAVPLPRVRPDAFLPYLNHLAPRLIVNSGGAWSTNLIHGIKIRPGQPDPRAIAAAMLSQVTALSGELEGRSYGGGVLKFETREAERLLIPVFTDAQGAELVRLFPSLDAQVRTGALAEASRAVDELLGLAHADLGAARAVFRRRRLERTKKS